MIPPVIVYHKQMFLSRREKILEKCKIIHTEECIHCNSCKIENVFTVEKERKFENWLNDKQIEHKCED
jgi:hypothetical protein